MELFPTYFARLPTTYPLALAATLPVAGSVPLVRVFAPVVMFPLVKVSAAPTVSFAPRVSDPPDLLTMALLNVVGAEPPIVWAPLPLNVTVVATPVRVAVALLLVQSPPTR